MVPQISGLMNQLVPISTAFSKDLFVPQISGLVNQFVPLRTVFSRPHGLTNQWFDESISAFKNSVRTYSVVKFA